mgnify:CR=1 FL=1
MKLSNLAAFVLLLMVVTSMSLAETPSFDLLNTQPEVQESSSNTVYLPPNISIDENGPSPEVVLKENLILADELLQAANAELNKVLKADLDKVDSKLERANELLVEYFAIQNQQPQDSSVDIDRMIAQFKLSHQLQRKARKIGYDQFEYMADPEFYRLKQNKLKGTRQ